MTFYGALARRLYRVRALLWFTAALALIAFLAAVFWSEGSSAEAYMILAVALLLWTLYLLVTMHVFLEPPPTIEAGDRLIVRANKRLRRLGYWLMAVIVVALTGGIVFLSVRAGAIAIRSFGG